LEPERQTLQARELAKQGSGEGHLELFEYPGSSEEPCSQVWGTWAETEMMGKEEECKGRASSGSFPAADGGQRAEFEQRLAEETRRSFEAGRERGRLEGRQAEHEAQGAGQTAAAERRARQAAELTESFARARDKYLLTVEHEVVELALAVAARILRREAQMDPLLLTGAVRVALGQLSGSTQVRLRVPPSELALWTETMALLPNLAVKPAVVAGEGMRLGECSVETEMGSVDLGIRAQLGEIERGFFDRAGGRAAKTTAETAAMVASTEARR
jgi:flagellar assembly protein FliH